MEFCKDRVFTALNADELRAGDKVITAHCMADLKTWVEADAEPNVIELIQDETNTDRFTCKCFNSDKTYSTSLAYLVERAENCTNCAEGRWDAEHQKILCDPVNCGNGNVVFRNHEIEVCEYWKPKTKRPELVSLGNGQYAEKPKTTEKHYRPFKDTDELVKVWCDKGGKWQKRELTMPHIWVCSKDKYKSKDLITGFNAYAVSIGIEENSMQDLFKDYEFLDGSPCGVEE